MFCYSYPALRTIPRCLTFILLCFSCADYHKIVGGSLSLTCNTDGRLGGSPLRCQGNAHYYDAVHVYISGGFHLHMSSSLNDQLHTESGIQVKVIILQ